MNNARSSLPLTVCLALTGLACVGSVDAVPSASPTEPTNGRSPGTGGSPAARPPGEGVAPTSPGGSLGDVKPPRACDGQPTPPDPPLRRLTMVQYRNTIRDLVRWALKDEALSSAAMPEVLAALAALPEDERPKIGTDEHGTFRRLDQSVSPELAAGFYDVARAVGALLTRPAHLPKVVGACPDPAATCVEAFMRAFGERAMRRPPEPEQLALYRRVYGDTTKLDPAALADVIGVMLTSPQLLYLVEHGGVAVPGRPGVHALTAMELASRLSFHFWDTMPDEPLWVAARSGTLSTADGFRRELDRVLKDPRARATLDQFAVEWMMLEDLDALDNLNRDPFYKLFAGPNLPKRTLRGSMIEDALDLFRHYVWTAPGSYDDLLTSELAFPRDADLAAIYGLETVWDGKSAPPRLPSGTRPGYLTRPAMLASAAVRTRPIIRGALLRTKTLCDEVPAPPAEAAALAEEAEARLSPGLGSRARTVAMTEALGPACAACHATLINPLGFALEGYDTLGRVRRQETVFGAKATDAPLLVPVDTRTVPRVRPEDPSPAAGPDDLVRLIQQSGKAHTCLARSYTRFTTGRVEDVARDKCAIAAVSEALERRAPLVEVWKAIALQPSFHEHNFGSP